MAEGVCRPLSRHVGVAVRNVCCSAATIAAAAVAAVLLLLLLRC